MGNQKNPSAKVRRKDGWQNLMTGLGSAKTAKKGFTHHVLTGVMTDQELESLFYDDGLSARIVKLLPDDMFREGWDYTFPKVDKLKAEELAEQYASEMETLEVLQKANVPVILVINKIDTVKNELIPPVIEAYKDLMQFEEIIPVSAKHSINKDELLHAVFQRLPYGEPFYDEETDG